MKVDSVWLIAGAIGAVGLMLALDEQLAAQAEGALTDITEGAAQAVDSVGIFKISRMATVDKSLVSNPQVRAMMAVIRRGEGTADDLGYSRMFGGAQFAGFNDHPRKAVTKWGYTSTAAGAYQALSSVWDETARLMGLSDFTPASQDLFALGRIAARGALPDVLAGNFTAAVRKLGREWASLPESPYGQGGISWDVARNVFGAAGGRAVA